MPEFTLEEVTALRDGVVGEIARGELADMPKRYPLLIKNDWIVALGGQKLNRVTVTVTVRLPQ